ncbi:MAG: aromatic amino acid lyase [Candidatus Doudnabacteria bacterium]|nr:aromatic amino acid lyase [Candidatus Doudnabacteria bacterium]
MKQKTYTLDGKNLTVEKIAEITKNNSLKVSLDIKSLGFVKKTRKFVEQAATENKKITYGINTGFGPMASYILPKADLIKLQYNLINSHAVGMGPKLPDQFVLAAMVVRLNTLLKGYSGVSEELLIRLEQFVNNRIIPIVPEHGAVGTSGDLVQLAHIALAFIGKGQVSINNKIQKASEALKSFKLQSHNLGPKEGLSLINGTSMMSGIAALACAEASRLLKLSTTLGCMALEIVGGYNDSFSEKLHSLRPHKGQVAIASEMRRILASSKRIKNRKALYSQVNTGKEVNHISEKVQEVYSLRCISQILGPIYDALQKSSLETEVEINSVTDNPIVDLESKDFLHGGNFHGEYIAQTMDHLKTSLVKLTMLSERRVNFFLNPNIEKNLPPFLNINTPGLTLALQGLQFVATSTTANSQTLAYPMSAHSISTNGDNQDVVSMGTDAALFTHKIIENAFIVLSIEAVALAQAVDILKIKNSLSNETKQLYNAVRKILPVIDSDNEITSELSQIVQELKNI